MNKKFVKITSIAIAVVFLLGLFAQFAYMFAAAEPISKEVIEAVEGKIKKESGERFRIMCEKGIGSKLDIIFSAKSISDFTDRIVIAGELAEYDKNMIKAVTELKSKNSSVD